MASNILRIDVQIMKALKKFDSFQPTSGMSIDEVMDIVNGVGGNKARSTYYRSLEKLINIEFVGRGCKDSHAKTYYVTDKGLKYLETGVL